jgi:protein O-GlcNAc transferase
MSKISRNDPCPCGSGRKYKHCCAAAAQRTLTPAIDGLLRQGMADHHSGRLSLAEAAYRQALALDSRHPGALQLLGMLVHQSGQPERGIEYMRRAIDASPVDPGLRTNLGNFYKTQERFVEALAEYRQALAIAPEDPDIHFNIGFAEERLGRLNAAREAYATATRLNPGDAEAWSNLGNVLRDQRNFEDAAVAFRKAIGLAPSMAVAHNNLGTVLEKTGDHDAALASYRQAFRLDPQYLAAINNLVNSILDLKSLGRLSEAMRISREVLAVRPDCVELQHVLGNCLEHFGRCDEALRAYQAAVVVRPDFENARSGICYARAWAGLGSPDEYLACARDWEVFCIPEGERIAARQRRFQNAPLAGRRLRVGFASGDFRFHAVSFFIERLFQHLNRERIEVVAYASSPHEDAVTRRIRSAVDMWVPAQDLDDAALRKRIEADRVDVLLDLAGHTNYGRLGAFARRAAPVQAYYLGYFASTGITEIDYWIGDEVVSPPEHDSHFSERVWRLPRGFMAYAGREDAPVPEPVAGNGGGLMLGSFNNLTKMTPATYRLWARVLQSLPGSRLFVKTKELADDEARRRLIAEFGAHGIDCDRLVLSAGNIKGEWVEHMAHYGQVDIALDPVGGMSGSTTTCDALWMGVPVVTLLGDRMASRVSASMLTSLGRTEWIATSEDDYVAKVLDLARAADLRDSLRRSLRDEMRRSALCDASSLATCLEEAFLEMYRRYEIEAGRGSD